LRTLPNDFDDALKLLADIGAVGARMIMRAIDVGLSPTLIGRTKVGQSVIYLSPSALAPQAGGMASERLISRDFGMNGASDHLPSASTISVQES
jgi:hypothetical protein